MKAISVRQPYAWLIVHGHKTVENRTWRTKYRGPVLIHAGKSLPSLDDFAWIEDQCDALGIRLPDDVDMGGIVGVADIVDCVEDSDSPWFEGPFAWVLANARPLSFHACAGKLGFFEVDHPLPLR